MHKIVFPGSFDPITNGHLDIIKRLSQMFEEVHIVIGINFSKEEFLTINERKDLISKVVNLENVFIDTTEDLVVDYCTKNKINLIAKGVRNNHDFGFEQSLNYNNKYLNSNIETILIFSNPINIHISSSVVKELLVFNHSIKHLVPIEVNNFLQAKKQKD